jgi:hypothetical protein
MLSATAPAGASSVIVSVDWTGGTVVQGQSQSGFVDDVDLEGLGSPPTTSVWAFAGSGDWNVSGNWSTGAVPNGPGQEADFGSIITANQNVYTDIAVTAGILNFNNAHTYVIDGAGSSTLQAATGSAQVIVQAGTQEINVPTTIASNTVFNVSAGTTLLIADPLTINSGKSLTTIGTGDRDVSIHRDASDRRGAGHPQFDSCRRACPAGYCHDNIGDAYRHIPAGAAARQPVPRRFNQQLDQQARYQQQ